MTAVVTIDDPPAGPRERSADAVGLSAAVEDGT